MGDGLEELARRRLDDEGIAEAEREDERGGCLQAQLARPAGEEGEPGAEEGSCQHEPALGEELGPARDREQKPERPEQRGEVARRAKDGQGEGAVDEPEAEE